MTTVIVSSDEFSLEVKRVAKKNEETLFNSLMDCCEKYDIPVEDVKPYITDALQHSLESEGIRLNLVKQERSKTKRVLK